MANKSASKGKQGYYASYKSSGKHAKNKKARIARAIKRDPNNEALKNHLLDINYTRKTPGSDTWSHSGIALAKVFKEFCGRFDKAILNSNAKQASEALQKLGSNVQNRKLPKSMYDSIAAKNPFSIAARVLG